MSNEQFDCPQCGEITETLNEGYCEDCRTANQASLDQHNCQHDHWGRLSDPQRAAEIKHAYR